MLRLRPYKACDAAIITKWIKSEKVFRQWSADRYDTYPITPEDMNLYYDRDRYTDRSFGMTAFDESGIVGHFTMRYPREEDKSEIRLGFVIVDDEKKGHGYGKEMVLLGIRYAFDFLKVDKVSIGVFENNPAAIHCYRSCGFQETEPERWETYPCMGEMWRCIEMERVRDVKEEKGRKGL